MVESLRAVCVSVRVERKYPKSVWWNGEVPAAVERKKAAWKNVLGARNETAKDGCMEHTRKEKG